MKVMIFILKIIHLFFLRNVTQETDNLKHATNAFLGLLSELMIMIGIIIFLLVFEPLSTVIIIFL